MKNFYLFNNIKYYIYTKNQFINLSIYLGHVKVKWNKVFRNFIYSFRNNIIIFKYDYLIYSIRRALNFIGLVLFKFGKLFFLSNFINKGLKSLNKYLLKKFSRRAFHSYYDGFYIGGLLSNLVSIYRTKQKKKKKKFSFSRKSLKKRFPAVIIISSLNSFFYVLREATNIGLPSIALIDSDLMYKDCLYPIIGNNESIIINFYFNFLFFLQIKLITRLKKFNYLVYYFKVLKYLLKFYIIYKFLFFYLYLYGLKLSVKKKSRNLKSFNKLFLKKKYFKFADVIYMKNITYKKNILILYSYEILGSYLFNINKLLMIALNNLKVSNVEFIEKYLMVIYSYGDKFELDFTDDFKNTYMYIFNHLIFTKIFFFKKFLFFFILKKMRFKYNFVEDFTKMRERIFITKYFRKYIKIIQNYLKRLFFKKLTGFFSFKKKLIKYFFKKKYFLKKYFLYNFFFYKKSSFIFKLFKTFRRFKRKLRGKKKKN